MELFLIIVAALILFKPIYLLLCYVLGQALAALPLSVAWWIVRRFI